ncbi:MAG: peptidyl-prolyl cis-trans isomerase [Calditerrivibrio sp.]|nr:peptidyl-prolyl cis-trans isomerase [Calditerrivibrio sp.]
MLKILKKRFKNENDYVEALVNTGITEDKLKKIYIDLNIVGVFEEDFKSRGIPDKEIKEYYENNKNMFMTGESVIVSNCLISGDARELNQKQMEEKYNIAKKVVELMKNKKFSEARKYCADKPYPEEDRIYKFSKGYNVEDILKLGKEDIGGPYKNIYGYLVIYVKDKKKSELLPLKEVKNEIETIMLNKKFREYLEDLLRKAQNENTVVITTNNS